jgi:hypothetical protein
MEQEKVKKVLIVIGIVIWLLICFWLEVEWLRFKMWLIGK